MPNIYLSKKTKEKLDEFIRNSRISPVFGSPNKFKSPEEAIEFLLQIGLKYPLNSLENLAEKSLVQFSLRMSDQKFDEFEESGELRTFIEDQFEKD